jgi:hypothetical protein
MAGQSAQRALPDAFGAAVEAWIESTIRGGPLEPHILDLREATPQLYAELAAELFGPQQDEEGG